VTGWDRDNDAPTTGPWSVVRFELPSGKVDPAEAMLFAAGAASVTLRDAADHPIHEPLPGEQRLWPRVIVEALFADPPDKTGLTQSLVRTGIALDAAEISIEKLLERDWTRAWMDRYRPMCFGQSLWVCPSTIEPDPDWPVVVRIDPGLAFGSGTHPTTALCLEWIDQHELAGAEVIDYGCGSGILAVACALKAADRVLAIDHDPQALLATRANARANRVADVIACQAPGEPNLGPVDCLLANILAEPLIALADEFAGRIRGAGRLVLSGILASQADSVRQAYSGHFTCCAKTERDGWVRLDFVRQPGSGP